MKIVDYEPVKFRISFSVMKDNDKAYSSLFIPNWYCWKKYSLYACNSDSLHTLQDTSSRYLMSWIDPVKPESNKMKQWVSN